MRAHCSILNPKSARIKARTNCPRYLEIGASTASQTSTDSGCFYFYFGGRCGSCLCSPSASCRRLAQQAGKEVKTRGRGTETFLSLSDPVEATKRCIAVRHHALSIQCRVPGPETPVPRIPGSLSDSLHHQWSGIPAISPSLSLYVSPVTQLHRFEKVGSARARYLAYSIRKIVSFGMPLSLLRIGTVLRHYQDLFIAPVRSISCLTHVPCPPPSPSLLPTPFFSGGGGG